MAKRGKSLTVPQKGEGDTPPLRIRGEMPRSLTDIKGIRAEMTRVYRLIFENKIFPEDGTKLIFILDKMVQAIRHEAEMATLANAYQDAWSGVNITPPTGEAPLLAPAAHVEILGPAQQSEENEHDETD